MRMVEVEMWFSVSSCNTGCLKNEFLTDLNGIQIIGPIIVVSKIVVGHVVIVVVVIIVVVALVRIDVADHVGGHGHG